MLRKFYYAAAVLPLVLTSGGCGGSGDGGEVPPVLDLPVPPPPPPPPSPPPTQNAAPLVAPVLTPSPAQPIAVAGGTSFSQPGSGAQIPLLLTAFSYPFAGDQLTTQAGGIIELSANGALSLTLNKQALGVERLPLDNSQTNIPGGTFQSFVSGQLGNQVRSIAWILTKTSERQGGVAVGGFVPPASAVPISGTATYTGPINGLVSEYHIAGGDGVAALLGSIRVEMNFATRSVTGTITGLSVGSDGFYVTGPVNDLTFTAFYHPSTNTYTGEVVSGASPGGPNAFVANARGTIVGQFFGPTAGSMGAVLTLDDGTSRLVIAFAAEKSP